MSVAGFDITAWYSFKTFQSFQPFKPPPLSSPAFAGEERGGGMLAWQ